RKAAPRPKPTAPEGEAGGRNLFEALRTVRRALAEERGVPPYVIFSDASLRDMAWLQPTTAGTFLEVKGVGEWKCHEFGERFMAVIRAHAAERT
ncbi:MAG: HRDC domain-containing protein, partial [Candidatus Rokuibacteriota bacterium]